MQPNNGATLPAHGCSGARIAASSPTLNQAIDSSAPRIMGGGIRVLVSSVGSTR